MKKEDKKNMQIIGLTIGIVVALGFVVLGVQSMPSNNQSGSGVEKKVYESDEKLVKVGETIQISGLRVTLNALVEDYRCSGTSCSEYGGIVANITLSDGEVKVTRNHPSDEVPYEFGGYKISVVKVVPEKVGNNSIPQNDYGVTFRVEPIK